MRRFVDSAARFGPTLRTSFYVFALAMLASSNVIYLLGIGAMLVCMPFEIKPDWLMRSPVARWFRIRR